MKALKIAIAFMAAACLPAFSDGVSVDSVFSSLTKYSVTSGDFAQEKSSAKLRKPLKSSGNFVFSKTGIVWQTKKPFPSTLAVTEDAIIQTAANGKKTVIDGRTSEMFKSVASSISSLFAGNRAGIEEHFKIKSFSSDSGKWTMSLVPKDATVASALSDIVLSGNVEEENFATIEMMKIKQSDSSTTLYKLLNITYRQELSENEKSLLSK